MLAVHPSIKPENQSFIKSKLKKWPQDGNLLEGANMLAFYPSIKPENQSFNKEKGKNEHEMETS